MQITNPNSDKPYDKVYKDHNGDPIYGIRKIDGAEELVNIKNGQSNMNYYQPEKVLDPSNCNHTFKIIDIAKREAECTQCRLGTSFVVGMSLIELPNEMQIIINNKKYPISL